MNYKIKFVRGLINQTSTGYFAKRIDKKRILTFIFILLFTVFSVSCKDKPFNPPNKDKVQAGNADNVIPIGTALKLVKSADEMAKVWSDDAILVSINGLDLGIDGYDKTNYESSKWVFTYFSAKKAAEANNYVITFNGKSAANWGETMGSSNTPLGAFTIDSSKAILTAMNSGLKVGNLYTMELINDGKITKWAVGSKQDLNSNRYDIKIIDANSGEVIK